jgi:hypothetical protein
MLVYIPITNFTWDKEVNVLRSIGSKIGSTKTESYGPYIILVGANDPYQPKNVKFDHYVTERNYAGNYDTIIYKVNKSWGSLFDKDGYPLAVIIDLK